MGDGCGAVVLSKNDAVKGIISHATYSHAEEDLNNIILDASLNAEQPGNLYFKMQGQQVYKYATTYLPEVIKETLDDVGLTPNEVDYFFFHQANAKMLRVIAHNLMRLYGITDTNYSHKILPAYRFWGMLPSPPYQPFSTWSKPNKWKALNLKQGKPTYLPLSVQECIAMPLSINRNHLRLTLG